MVFLVITKFPSYLKIEKRQPSPLLGAHSCMPKIPFGLMNAGATFQQAMDITFIGERDKFVVVYLDDITVFSKSDREHCCHLRRVFLKCKRFGLSLNPKKSLFAMKEGKLLGHIVSTKGVRIDVTPCFPQSVKITILAKNYGRLKDVNV
jgi:hypothetical protein